MHMYLSVSLSSLFLSPIFLSMDLISIDTGWRPQAIPLTKTDWINPKMWIQLSSTISISVNVLGTLIWVIRINKNSVSALSLPKNIVIKNGNSSSLPRFNLVLHLCYRVAHILYIFCLFIKIYNLQIFSLILCIAFSI